MATKAPRASADEMERRLLRVEDVLRERGWSMRIECDLAQELGVARQAVRAYKLQALARLKAAATIPDLEERRQGFLLALQEHIDLATRDGKHGPAASMLGLQSRLLGLDQPQQVDVSVTIIAPAVAT